MMVYRVIPGLSLSVGTNVDFCPPCGSGTMLKSGLTFETRYQCISAMKEYEKKSLEELRLEDMFIKR